MLVVKYTLAHIESRSSCRVQPINPPTVGVVIAHSDFLAYESRSSCRVQPINPPTVGVVIAL